MEGRRRRRDTPILAGVTVRRCAVVGQFRCNDRGRDIVVLMISHSIKRLKLPLCHSSAAAELKPTLMKRQQRIAASIEILLKKRRNSET